MKRKAVIITSGTKYAICCDVEFLQTFFEYVLRDDNHRKEIKLIFDQIKEGLKSPKFGDEPNGTKAMKPFKNRENDRIICNVTKRNSQKQCIVMSEIYLHKTSQQNNKELTTRYNIVSKYVYEIIN